MNKTYFIGLIFLLGYVYTVAQEVPVKTQQQLENLADATEAEEQDDTYLLQLGYLMKNPLNLNTATVNELQVLRFLTDLQIYNFLQYRSSLGKLVNLYELQAVPTWDLATIQRLLPYVSIGPAVSIKENFASRFKKGEQSFLFRISRTIERSKGYDTSPGNYYLGDRNHILIRYRYQYKNLLQYGLVADKDAGEQFFKGGQSQGFDFYSVHLFARSLGKIKALALGDYTVNLGQGLIQWQSLGFGKSADITGIKRQSNVLSPYRSAGEFNFNRGVGATVQIGKMEATAFASYKKFSGNNLDTSTFSSILPSGYHRTKTEIEDRNSIGLFSAGSNINFSSSNWKIGFNSVYYKFSKAFEKRNEPYNYYSFSGRTLWAFSVDYSYTYKNVHFFGETAFDNEINRAMLNGLLVSVDPRLDLSFLHRTMSKEYRTVFGNAFTENTLPVNETGAYAGFIFRPLRGWTLNAYADFFKFPWLKYRVDAPGSGNEYLIQLDYQPSKFSQVYFLYRTKARPLNEKGTVIDFPVTKTRQNLRLHVITQIHPSFTLKARSEMIWYNRNEKDEEEGFLAFIEGTYKRNKFQSGIRLQYFETGGYNSRIYAYENDVLYSFSIPAFFDKGYRYYLNLNYDVNKFLTLWMRWAQIIYSNKLTIGSGLDEINGKQKSEIKFQLVMSF